MFSSSTRTALVALIASALAVSAKQGLSLKVAGADSVTDVENLTVVATITNTGDESLKILNDPRSPLSKLPADTFTITDAAGSRPAFTGIKAKYVPQAVAAAGVEGSFTVLAPGASIEVEHDLSKAYNFTGTGEGEYQFEANNLFYVVSQDNKVVPLYAEGEAHAARVTGKLAVAKPTLSKRATFVGCTAARQTLLNTAATNAQTYAANARSYITANTAATTRYTTWFGTFTSARRSTVLSHYTLISGNTFSSYTYDCTCTDSGTYAYVYPSEFGIVYLCGAFWNAPATGTDSKAGTLVHESSHFTANGGTDDHAYGQTACKSLALSSPANAVDNADSHEYFAENTPALS